MTPELRRSLRMATRHFYDIQLIKNQHGLRVRRTKTLITEEDREYLAIEAKRLAGIEKDAFERVKELLARIPFWTDVLSQDEPRFKGFAETMASVILSEIDIERATTISKMWRYCGLCPIPALRCTTCNRLLEPEEKVKGCQCDACVPEKIRAERYRTNSHNLDHEGPLVHMKKRENEKKCKTVRFDGPADPRAYRSGRAEHTVPGEERPFNLFTKTKMVGVLGNNLMRCGNEVYRKIYDDYKHRLVSAGKGTSDGNRHNASVRYMVKMFLADIWREWREYEGLEVRPPYSEEKLGHKHEERPAPRPAARKPRGRGSRVKRAV